MPTILPRTFPALDACEALSQPSLASHLRLYNGYVEKCNTLMERLESLQRRGPAAIADVSSLKGDIAFALGAIKNHDLFFDILGPESPEPAADLHTLIVKSFHSLPQFLVDLKHTAQQGRGWVWTAYDLDHHHLFNYDAGSQNGLPVWNTIPILAIDLYGHSYFYDYGNNKVAYIEAVMKSLNWARIAQRLTAARTIGASQPR